MHPGRIHAVLRPVGQSLPASLGCPNLEQSTTASATLAGVLITRPVPPPACCRGDGRCVWAAGGAGRPRRRRAGLAGGAGPPAHRRIRAGAAGGWVVEGAAWGGGVWHAGMQQNMPWDAAQPHSLSFAHACGCMQIGKLVHASKMQVCGVCVWGGDALLVLLLQRLATLRAHAHPPPRMPQMRSMAPQAMHSSSPRSMEDLYALYVQQGGADQHLTFPAWRAEYASAAAHAAGRGAA